MKFSFDSRYVNGRPGPERAIIVNFSFQWHRSQPAFLLDMEGSVSWNDRVLTEAIYLQTVNWLGEHPAILEKENLGVSATLVIPLSSEAIRYIEERRQQSDVSLRLKIRYRWQEAFRDESPRQIDADQPEGRYLTGAVSWQPVEHSVNIARSDWLRLLGQMEWGHTELFEVAAIPFHDDPNLTEALRLLQDATTALRSSDPKGVLTKCREAFESAAKYESAGDLKKGYELLLARAFPEEEAKRSLLNSLIKNLTDYAHLGRHAQYPALHIGREEAEFMLTASLGLFSMLSRRLT